MILVTGGAVFIHRLTHLSPCSTSRARACASLTTSRTAHPRPTSTSSAIYAARTTFAASSSTWSKSLGLPLVYDAEGIAPGSVIRSGLFPRRVMDCREKMISKRLDGIYASGAAVVIAVYLATLIKFADRDDVARNFD